MKTLIVVNIAVFLLQMLMVRSNFLVDTFALIPQKFLYGFHWWTVATYGFLHGDFFHIFFNLFALFVFGRHLEAQFGKKWFLGFYFYCLIGSGAVIVMLAPTSTIPTLGASGAVLGCVTAFACLYPNARLYLFLMFIPVPVRAKWLAIGYAVVSALGIWRDMQGSGGGGISHSGHLGGIVFGFLYFLALKQGWVGRRPHAGRSRSGNRSVGDRVKSAVRGARRVVKPADWSHWSDDEIRDEMDRVLKKVGQTGIHSLSDKEQKFLKDVSKYYQDKNLR